VKKKLLITFLAIAAAWGCVSRPSPFCGPTQPYNHTSTPTVFATATCTATQTITPCCGSIRGNIKAYDCTAPAASATPCAYARVKAFSGGVQKAFAVADEAGNYSIDTLVPGVYDLTVQILKYGIDASLTGINVTAGQVSTANLVEEKQWQANTICFDDPTLVSNADALFLLDRGVMCVFNVVGGNLSLVVTSMPESETPDSIIEAFNARPPATMAHKCFLSCP
jgi:hypothetical protein